MTSDLYNSTAATTLPERILHSDAYRKFYPEQAVATQQIQCSTGQFLFCCHFVCISRYTFESLSRFRHISPPISRIILFQNDAARLTCDGESLELQPGVFHLLPAGHSFDIDYPAGISCLALHANFTDGAFFSLTRNLPSHLSYRNDLLFQALFAIPPQDYDQLLATFMPVAQGLLKPYFQDYARHSTAAVGIYREMLHYLEEAPPGKIRIDDLARQYHLSRSALSKGFYRQFGISIKEHLQDITLHKAKTMLVESTLSPKEIAQELGICDLSNFYRFFRRRTGVTPAVFRQNHQKDS